MEYLPLLALPVAGILLAGLAVALAALLQYRLAGALSPDVRVAITLVVVGAGAMLSVALDSRTLDDAQRVATDFDAFDVYENYAKGFAASRWLSLLLLGASCVEIVRGYLRAQREHAVDPAGSLLAAVLAFHIGTLAIQAVASDNTGFSHKDLYLPIVLVASCFQRLERTAVVFDTAKWLLLVLTASSLVMAIAIPDFAIHRPDVAIFPGVDWRLYGITPHANTLGPAALVAILLELYRPSRRLLLRSLHLGSAATVLALAQSRTAWAAALLIVVAVVVPLGLRPGFGPNARPLAFRRAVWTLVACIVAASAFAVAWLAFGLGDIMLRKLELTTLNGRSLIWDITLRAWKQNILFGYGAEIWGMDRRFQFRMFYVGHAHNQFVQTLGEAGLAGLALLLLFLGTLLRAAVSCFVESRGLVLSLLIVLLARCVTEAPIRSEGLLTWSTFLQVLIVVLACHYLRQPTMSLPKASAAQPWEGRAFGKDNQMPRPI